MMPLYKIDVPVSPALKRLGHITLLIAFLSVLVCPVSGGSPANWGRLLVPIGHGPPAGLPFTIRGYTFMDGLLSADGWLCYTQHSDPVILHGQQDADHQLF